MRRIVQRTLVGGKTEARCTRGKDCKKTRGLKRHQARSRCGIVTSQKQRTELTDETQEDPSQDKTHRVRNLFVSESSQDSNGDLMEELGIRAREGQQTKGNAREKILGILWPKGEDGVLWSSSDDDVSMILDSTMQEYEERKIETLTNMVYNIGMERFGTKKVK